MNAILAVPDVPVSPRERMKALLDALVYGLYPGAACSVCRKSVADWCPECAQALAVIDAVHAGITAVEDAENEGQALAAYTACLTGLVNANGGHDD